MSETAPLTREGLLNSFEQYGTPRASWRVGAEFERTVVRPDGSAVGYFDADGIGFILEEIAKRDDWERVTEGENVIALTKNGASVTLEPGGQVELSGAPHHTLTDLGAEMYHARARLLEIARGRPLRWIAAGLTPFAPIDSISFVPKSRYDVMEAYLPQFGHLAHYMMKGTTAVQASFDYSDETDCAQKVRLAARLAPLTIAIFANSPLLEGRDTGYQSYRAHVWRHTDPARTGLPPALIDHYSHQAWLDYLLDVPMMFVHHEDRYHPAHGMPFRKFLCDGFRGRLPDAHDWELHQTSVFPEVRVKKLIEVRGADCVDHRLAMSFCALFTGLFYCRQSKDEALQFADELFATGEPDEMLEAAARAGLNALAGGRSLADWASDLGDIAQRGLGRCLPGDVHLLDPLLENIEEGRSPADKFREAFERDPSPDNVLAAIAY